MLPPSSRDVPLSDERETRERTGRSEVGLRHVARIVVCCELEEQAVQLLALVRVEPREKLLLDALGDLAQLGELLLPLGLEADEMPAAVGRIAAPLDQPVLLELVEQPDEPAAVVAERVCDRRLRLARALVERAEDAVVVRALAGGLERRQLPRLDLHPQPREQEAGAAH